MTSDLMVAQRKDVESMLQAIHGTHGSHAGHNHDPKTVDILYRSYTNHSGDIGKGLRHVNDSAGTTRFVASLALANASRWSWLADCRYIGIEGQQFVVSSPEGSERRVHPMSFDGPNADGRGKLLQEKEMIDDQGAWYFALGEDTFSSHQEKTIRVYWALSAEGAALFVHEATSRLNKNKVPFTLKVLKDPSGYGRGDGGVLYLPRYCWDRASAIVQDIHAQVEPYLQDRTVKLAKRIAKGLAVAEDPGKGESFGMSRAKLMADLATGAECTPDELLNLLEKQGYPNGKLHLNPGTPRDFSLNDHEGPAKVQK